MMDVIPSINCSDERCAREKIGVLKRFLATGAFVHLDATDGAFTGHQTWSDPKAWMALGAPFALEVHLMVASPREHAEDWFAAGARRLVVHAEMLTDDVLHDLLQVANRYRGELVLTSKPDTAEGELMPFVSRFARFQVLAVQPGAAGQAFLPVVVKKIKFLREAVPDATIEVDGGINPDTARLVKEAGADTLVSANYIFNHKNPQSAFEALQNI